MEERYTECKDLEVQAYRDHWYDVNFVRVMRYSKDEKGRLLKRGLSFGFTDELLEPVAEGCAIPKKMLGKEELMTFSNSDWEAEVWRDEATDRNMVKVRKYVVNKDGNRYKRGLIFSFTDEMVDAVGEGGEFPCRPVSPVVETPVPPAAVEGSRITPLMQKSYGLSGIDARIYVGENVIHGAAAISWEQSRKDGVKGSMRVFGIANGEDIEYLSNTQELKVVMKNEIGEGYTYIIKGFVVEGMQHSLSVDDLFVEFFIQFSGLDIKFI